MRYTGPKNRIARRFGANIFGKKRNPLMKRPNPPGVHGARRKKKSDYGIQLQEKQKLKACYGMLTEKQLVLAFKKAQHHKGNTVQHFLSLLERRLDVMVYRLGFASSIFGAQQLVSHGHIHVNGKKVDRRSFLVAPGMTIQIKPASRTIKCIVESLASAKHELASYLTLNKEEQSGKLLSDPLVEEIEGQLPLPIRIADICQFLAHTT